VGGVRQSAGKGMETQYRHVSGATPSELERALASVIRGKFATFFDVSERFIMSIK